MQEPCLCHGHYLCKQLERPRMAVRVGHLLLEVKSHLPPWTYVEKRHQLKSGNTKVHLEDLLCSIRNPRTVTVSELHMWPEVLYTLEKQIPVAGRLILLPTIYHVRVKHRGRSGSSHRRWVRVQQVFIIHPIFSKYLSHRPWQLTISPWRQMNENFPHGV